MTTTPTKPMDMYIAERDRLAAERAQAIRAARDRCAADIAAANAAYKAAERAARERCYNRSPKRVHAAGQRVQAAADVIARQYDQCAMFAKTQETRAAWEGWATWLRDNVGAAVAAMDPEKLVLTVATLQGRRRMDLLEAIGLNLPEPPEDVMPGVEPSGQAPEAARAAADASTPSPVTRSKLDALMGMI